MSDGPRRILLVEDNPGDVRLVREYIASSEGTSVELVVARSLAEACRTVSESDWHAILLDLDLPDSRGIATFRAVYQSAPEIPIVVLTGGENNDSALEAIHKGAQDYLPKGILSAELLARTIRYAVERARTRSELDEERSRLFSVLGSLPMFVYLQAPDFTIPFANRTFHELFGETEGRLCYEVFHDYDEPCSECPPMRVQESGVPEIWEWTSPKGRTYVLYDQVFPSASDTPLTLEVGLDITEQRRAQEELAQSEARFRRLAENAPDIIYRYRITPKPRFEYLSPAVTGVSGYTPEEFYADPLLGMKIVHPDDRHHIEGVMRGRVNSRRTLDVRWVHRDGDVRWIEDHHVPVFDESGRLIAIEGVARDITEWKQAQEALADSEERYRLLFEHAGIGIGYYTPEGTLIDFNRVAAAHMGGLPADFAGESILDLFGEENGLEYLQRVVDVARTGRTVTFEDFAELPTGPKWFLSTYSRVEGSDGKVVGVQVFSEEITDRKRAEAEREDSETRYRSLFEASVLGIYRTTPDGRILVANPALLRMLGHDSFEELAQRNLEEEGYEPEIPREEFKALIEREGSLVGRESAWKRRDGRTIYVRENARAIRDEAGNVLYYEGTVEDITERKTAEREAETLRTQLDLTQFSIDSTDAVILWVRPDGHLTYVNEAACRMLEYTREELLTKAVWDLDPAYAKADRPAKWTALKRVGSEIRERNFRTKSGERFPVEITAQYLEFRGMELEFAVAFDISERKRLESQLRQSQRLESIGTLASGVAHEINNPLTGIINYAQLISDRIEDEKLKKFADGIREEGDRVAKIVRNLLSFSRREIEHHSPARLADIVEASLSLYRALLRRNRIEVVVDMPEDLPKIHCRSQEIQQVVINLITNARDSLNLRFPGGDEEKRIAIRVQVLEEDERRWVRLTVEDRGRGIEPAAIGRVFDPFFTTKPRDQGTGLGLSISYGLVRDHGGRMSVESIPNDVTRFFVDLPIPAE